MSPVRTVRCSICGKGISGYDFPERMGKLRHHYKRSHPAEFREWYKNPGTVRALVHPEAIESLKRYKDDLKAGHKDAAEYWRGQAGAYFTANSSDYHIKKTYARSGRISYEVTKGKLFPVMVGEFNTRGEARKKIAELERKENEEYEEHFTANPLLETVDTDSITVKLTKIMGQPIRKPTRAQLRRWAKMPDPTVVSKECHDEAWRRGMVI